MVVQLHFSPTIVAHCGKIMSIQLMDRVEPVLWPRPCCLYRGIESLSSESACGYNCTILPFDIHLNDGKVELSLYAGSL